MENQLKQVCLCLLHVAGIEDTIASNRLSFSEVAAVMEMVDLKRRGYLDLNDIFELVGKVTETELFTIFKHLDRSRTGEVRVADLQAALGNSQLTSNNTAKEYVFPRFYKMVDTIKDRQKLTREAVKQHGLTSASLKGAYQYICELVQSKYLSKDELITVLKTQFIKNGLKWTSHCQTVIQELLPGQNVSQAKFIEAFTSKNTSDEGEQECLLKGISDMPAATTLDKNQSIYTKLKLNDLSPNNEKPATFSRKVNNFLDQPSEVKTPVFNQSKTSYFAQSKNSNFSESVGGSPSRNESSQYKSNFEQIENNISSVLDNIQQRRDKLRQDSLERKKLIEDVMNRKKQLFNSSDWTDGSAKDWERDQYKNSSNVKKVAKSYLNHNPTFYQTQQLSRHQDNSQSFKRQDSNVARNEGSTLTYQRSCGHLKAVSPPAFVPYEPRRNNEAVLNSEISQILKKYTANTPENREEATLKSLCKSKSGFIYENPHTRDSSSWRREAQYENYDISRGGVSSSKARDSYKENVMRRAEEEAAKKIEEIERKARMKVLEKKGRREDLEWNRLMKHGINF